MVSFNPFKCPAFSAADSQADSTWLVENLLIQEQATEHTKDTRATKKYLILKTGKAMDTHGARLTSIFV